MHQPLAQKYFYSGSTAQPEGSVYLLVGLQASEILLMIPMTMKDCPSIEIFIRTNIKFKIPLNSKIVGVLNTELHS